MIYTNTIFVTVKPKDSNVPFQNKVAIRCNFEEENIMEVAKSAFDDICGMDKFYKERCIFEVFVRFGKKFYKIEESC